MFSVNAFGFFAKISFIITGPIPFVTFYISAETVNLGGEFSQIHPFVKALQKKKFHPDILFVTRENVGYLFLFLFVGYGTSFGTSFGPVV